MDTIEIKIPKAIDNLQLPDPAMVNYWRLAEKRSFYIDYEIDVELLEIQREIILANMEDKDVPVEDRVPIKLWVYSYGGDLDAAYSLISAIEMSKTPVITINAGVSMSAGLLILLAGHRRFATKRSTALIHSGSAVTSGTYEQIVEGQKQYDNMVKLMGEFIVDRTRITKKLFNKNKSKDWYISDIEQLELGIVDGILESFDSVI